MHTKIIALGLTPTHIPAVLRNEGITFHESPRTLEETPDVVITAIEKLDAPAVTALRAWKEEGCIIVDLTTEAKRSPLADAAIGTQWDESIVIMRLKEAMRYFSPNRDRVKPSRQGDIEPNDLAVLFQRIMRSRQSGALVCRQKNREHIFFFLEGVLQTITTNVEGEHLGSFLVQKGKITPHHFASATRHYFATGHRIGECLVATRAIKAEDLDSLLNEHLEYLGMVTFAWSGEWAIYPFTPSFSADQVFPLKPERFILKALNGIKEYEAPTPLPWEETAIVKAEVDDLEDLSLTPEEYYLLEQLGDQAIEVRHVYALLPPPEKEKDRSLFRLYASGVVSVSSFDPLDEVIERAEKAKKQTCYEILGVTMEADTGEIRSSYFTLARKYHPDRFAGSERFPMVKNLVEKYFSAINEAYQILSNPEERREYDMKMTRLDDRKLSPQAKIADLMREVRSALSAKQISLAVQKLNEIIYLGGANAEVHRLMGQALLKDPNMLKEAENHLRESLSLDPKNADTHFFLGLIYIKAGLTSRARRHLQETLKLQPAHLDAETLLNGLDD